MEINLHSNQQANSSKSKKYHIIGIFTYFLLLSLTMLLLTRNNQPTNSETLSTLRMLNKTREEQDLINAIKRMEQGVLTEPLLIAIHNKEYRGTWKMKDKDTSEEENHSSVKKNYFSNFKRNQGSLIMKFTEDEDLVSAIGTINHIQISFHIKDGEYRENWIYVRQEFSYSNGNLNRNSIEVSVNPTNFVASIISKEKTQIESKIYNMKLLQAMDYHFSYNPKFNITLSGPNYNKINGELTLPDVGLDMTFDLQEGGSNTYKKVNIFTLVLTVLGILHCYHSLLLIRESILGVINPKSFSITFIAIDMMWNSILSIGSFYISTSFPNYFNNFALPSLLFFVNFSVFQIRFLFVLWRYQNLDDIENETAISLRRKMTKFYLILYLSLFISLLSMYFILVYKWILFYILASTFVPQIYHNCRVNISRNKIPAKSIIIIGINRIYFPMYYLLCPHNIIETEPNYLYSFVGLGLFFLQILIMYLQSVYGGMFFIPKSWRKGYFDYYKSLEDIRSFKRDLDTCYCSICLNPFVEEEQTAKDPGSVNLVSSSGMEELRTDFDKNSNGDYHSIAVSSTTCRDKFRKIIRRGVIKGDNEKLMVTPCNHIFHPNCLKKWGEMKNECPVCRKIIPYIGD